MAEAMIVEFSGIPGSGKTAVCTMVMRALRGQGIQSSLANEYRQWVKHQPFFTRLCLMAYAGAANAAFLLTVPWRVIAGCRDADRKLIVRMVLVNVMERQMSPGRSAEVLFFDEGLVHRAYSLFVHSDRTAEEKAMYRYIDTVRMPDLLVYLRTDASEAFRRIEARGVPKRMARLTEQASLDMLTRGARFLDSYFDACRKRRGLDIAIIEDRDLEAAKERILELIKAKMKDR